MFSKCCDHRISRFCDLSDAPSGSRCVLNRYLPDTSGFYGHAASQDWTWSDAPEAIAEVWYRLQPTKAVRAASAVLQLAKATTPKPKVRRGARA